MDPVSRAQSSNSTAPRKVIGRPFPKGVSGNPGGRPKKLHITKMFEQILAKAVNRKEIKDALMEILTGGRMASVLLIREMAERTEGKVVQEVDMNLSGSVSLEQVLEARKKAEK